MKSKDDSIIVGEIGQLGDGSDWGAGYEWVCPRCGETVRHFEGGDFFNECSCRSWRLILYAKGEDLELDEKGEIK